MQVTDPSSPFSQPASDQKRNFFFFFLFFLEKSMKILDALGSGPCVNADLRLCIQVTDPCSPISQPSFNQLRILLFSEKSMKILRPWAQVHVWMQIFAFVSKFSHPPFKNETSSSWRSE